MLIKILKTDLVSEASSCSNIYFSVYIFLQIAMADQKLDNRELLNVRWAFDDPNPKSRKEVNTIACPL